MIRIEKTHMHAFMIVTTLFGLCAPRPVAVSVSALPIAEFIDIVRPLRLAAAESTRVLLGYVVAQHP